MADRVLREQCEHGRFEPHGESTSRVVRNDKDDLITESETSWCPGGREVTVSEVTVVFDGPPGPEPGRFIEVENPETGESIKLGKWYEVDGLWYLAFDAALGVTDDG